MDATQQEMAMLHKQAATYEAEIVQLEADVNGLRKELRAFESRYDAVVGAVMKRIDAVKAAINDLELFQRQPHAQGDIPDIESLWKNANNTQQQQSTENTQKQNTEPIADHKSANKATSQKVKALYRKLARRYHPDYAIDEADRERRTQLMTIINTAYQNNDIEALNALDNAPQPRLHVADYYDSAMPLQHYELNALRRRVRDLGGRLDKLRVEHSSLLNNSFFDLKLEEKFAQANGRDLLKEIAADMELEYQQHIAHLDELRNQIESRR